WSYGAISLGFSLQWLVLGIVSPYIGSLGDRYGVRRLLLLGACLFIAGMLLTGIMTSLWEFYLYFGVMLGVATTLFSILLVTGVTLWFRKHLGVAMGARRETFMGLSGVGDLVVTTSSPHSRNHRFGELLAEGKGCEEALKGVGMVVEGYSTTKSARALGKKMGVEMPITEAVYGVLYDGRTARNALEALLAREAKAETQ
ncbi:MFS transporter, partial [Candidatus Sumerlaeota bacterium]|nr:MFS transporter [Candidatus Sumerlaeota bacterium]